ncbi:hypothetical protein MBLNU459_g0528t1 [Dothideomycetes sp. NU459]
MPESRVVVVTGANRGIGLAICSLILSSTQPVKLYAASRSGADLALKSSSPSTSISYPQLDVTNQRSIDALVRDLEDQTGHVDVLINNAGLNAYPEHSPEGVEKMLNVNYRGTLRVIHPIFRLILRPSVDMIVNMSSTASNLKIYSPEVRSRFRNPDMTIPELDRIAQDYLDAVAQGRESASGFSGPGQGYCVTKACVNALTSLLARENPGLVINACCPGWVDTDMGGIMGKPPKTAADGARIPVRLGFGDVDGVTGRYWANDSIASTDSGRVQE